MNINEFDYQLPKELIAQRPLKDRDQCRLMILDRQEKSIEQKKFYDVLEYLKPGDCIVMNDSKVIPARIFGVKESTGAKIEFLLIKRIEGDLWETMVRPGKRLKLGFFYRRRKFQSCDRRLWRRRYQICPVRI